jgi:hypothetical protein
MQYLQELSVLRNKYSLRPQITAKEVMLTLHYWIIRAIKIDLHVAQ